MNDKILMVQGYTSINKRRKEDERWKNVSLDQLMKGDVEIMKKEILSGRKVWELLYQGCKDRNIQVEEKRFDMLKSYQTSRYMEKKWKAYLRREKRQQPGWNEMTDLLFRFFSVLWEHMCQNIIYLGDWMPELGRCIDS